MLSNELTEHYGNFKKLLSDRNLSRSTRRIYSWFVNDFINYLKNATQEPATALDHRSMAEHREAYLTQLTRERFYSLRSLCTARSATGQFIELLGFEVRPIELQMTTTAPKVLSQTEEAKLREALNKLKGEWEPALATMMLDAGARPGECSRLKLNDIHLEPSSNLLFWSGAHDKVIPVSSESMAILERWVAVRKTSVPVIDEEYFFLNRNGRKISPSGLDAGMRRVFQAAGINTTSFALRNTFLAGLYRSGGHAGEIIAAGTYTRSGAAKFIHRLTAI